LLLYRANSRSNIAARFKVVNGGTPKTGIGEYWDGPHQWITPAEMGKRASPYIDETERTISDAGLRNSSARLLPPNSVILSSRAPIGHLVINTTQMATNQGCKGLVPGNGLDSKFLYYYLLSIVPLLNDLGTGATFKELSGGKLKEVLIPLPPIPEQHRIVALLDEAFAGIATAKANAEKNLQNARALFESHLQSVFTERGEGWVATKLAEVCGFQNGFAFKSSSFKQTGIPIIRISNIQDGRIDTDNRLVFFDPNDYRENLDRYRIIKNDLLIAMSGATTGKLGFNTESTVFYLNQRVGKFEPGEKLNKRFLYYFLSTKIEENLRISAGAAQPNLSTEQIKNFLLPLPPIDEQAHIVESLEELSEETQRLESLYQQKISALDELKQSLLHQAFSGNL
jgi:type I restriction enzyme S subunit